MMSKPRVNSRSLLVHTFCLLLQVLVLVQQADVGAWAQALLIVPVLTAAVSQLLVRQALPSQTQQLLHLNTHTHTEQRAALLTAIKTSAIFTCAMH